MIVSHLFDRARSLAAARNWCDRHHIALIEDCAHAPFGMAGARPAGHWGDVATASLTKFSPAPELGLLAAPGPPPRPPVLVAPRLRHQLKAVWDALECAAPHNQPAGLYRLTGWLNHYRLAARSDHDDSPISVTERPMGQEALSVSDMGRIDQRPTWTARALAGAATSAAAAAARRTNHAALLETLTGLSGARPLFGPCPPDAAPYAVPVWIDDANVADTVYATLRAAGDAVYRWDRVWPDAPAVVGDHAPSWRRHVLQCLCHASLTRWDMCRLGQRISQRLALNPVDHCL